MTKARQALLHIRKLSEEPKLGLCHGWTLIHGIEVGGGSSMARFFYGSSNQIRIHLDDL